MTIYRDSVSNRVMDDGKFIANLFIGGGRTGAANHYRRAKSNFHIFADVPQELTAIRNQNNIWKTTAFLPLGHNVSLDRLLEDRGGEFAALKKLIGAMDARKGLGQLRGAGELVVERELKTSRYKELISQLHDEIQIATGGRASQIILNVFGSVAGGTAAGAAKKLANKIAKDLAKLGLPVVVNYELLDATTYAGLGARVGKNAAATISELSFDILAKEESNRESIVRNMSVSALPPFRHNKATRDWFVALDTQGIACGELQEVIQRGEPNYALDSAFGNITYRSLDLFEPLNPETDVAPDAAHSYLPHFDGALKNARPLAHLISNFKTKRRAEPLFRETVEVALNAARHADDFIEAIERPAESVVYSITAQLADNGQEIDLSRIDEYCLSPMNSIGASTERLFLLRTLRVGVDEERGVLRDEISRLTNEQVELRENIRRRFAGPRGFFSFFESVDGNRRQLIQLAESLRVTSDALLQAIRIEDALDQALSLVNIEETQLTRELESVRAILESFPRRGQDRDKMAFAFNRSINDAFPELKLLPTMNRDEQIACLASQVVHVTLAGLAKVVNAIEPRVELIARQIVNGPYDYLGPFVGATRREGGQVAYVLPPLYPKPADELFKEIAKLDPKAVIAFADFAACGVTVLRYHFVHPQTADELFPGTLAHCYEDAVNDPLKPLYFPAGDEARISPSL